MSTKTSKTTTTKAAAKKVAEKKAEPKKAAAKKSAEAAKKPEAEKPAEPTKRKALTVVKKPTPRVAPKQSEEQPMFENKSQSFAYKIAEARKRAEREAEERKEAERTVKLSRRPTSRGKGGTGMQFPAADLEEFRKKLIEMRHAALGQSANLKNIALEQTEESGTEDEDGSDAFLRLQSLSQVDSQNRQIQQIDEALARIEEGTYGICDVCGQLIRKPRLLHLPFAHTCIECQSEMEEKPLGGR